MELNINNLYAGRKIISKEHSVNENYKNKEDFSKLLGKKVDRINTKTEKSNETSKKYIEEKNSDHKEVNKNEINKKNANKKADKKSESKDEETLNDDKSKLEKEVSQLLSQLLLKLNNDKENKSSLEDILKELGDGKDSLKMILDILSSDKIEDLNGLNLKDKNDLKDFLKDLMKFMEKSNDKENLELIKKLNSFMEKISSKNSDEGKNKKEDNLLLNLKEMLPNVDDKEETNKYNEQNNSKNGKDNLSKEDKLLEKLTGNNDNKFSKVNQFMNLMNTSRVSPLDNLKSVENLVINKVTFNDDIIKSIKYMEINNLKDLTVKINPKNLGEVVISLTMDNDVMKAQLKSSNKETFALLNASLNEINEKLNGNIKIQQVEVSIYNEDTTYFSGEANKEQNSSSNNGQNSEKKYNDSIKIEEIDSADKETLMEDNSNVDLLI